MYKYLAISAMFLSILLISCEDQESSENINEILFSNPGEFTDSRDGKVYKTVEIGGRTWMAENLAYIPKVATNEDYDPDLNGKDVEYVLTRSQPRYFVYKNVSRNVDVAKESAYYKKYGVLYNWNAAVQNVIVRNTSPSGVQGICPDGWHLPSDAEWSTLVSKLGNSSGIRAKSLSGWALNGNGNNTGGLELLPGGMLLLSDFDYNFKITRGDYFGESEHGGWWTATSTEGPDVRRDLQFNAMSWTTSYNSELIIRNNVDQATGLSIRCVKDY